MLGIYARVRVCRVLGVAYAWVSSGDCVEGAFRCVGVRIVCVCVCV